MLPNDIIARIEPDLFIASASLFVVGYLASYPVVVYDVSFLTWYPLRVWRRVRATISPDDPWHRLFVFLLVFNTASLLANLLAGFLVILPPIFAFLMGLNIGVISVKEAGAAGLASILVNPVAWLELPAAWVSLALGTRLGIEAAYGPSAALSAFPELIQLYVYVVLPLLVAAALLEATLIRLAESGFSR